MALVSAFYCYHYDTHVRAYYDVNSEPKSAELRDATTSVLVMVFEAHPPLFARILAALPLPEADAARHILTVRVHDWELRTEQPIDEDDDVAYLSDDVENATNNNDEDSGVLHQSSRGNDSERHKQLSEAMVNNASAMVNNASADEHDAKRNLSNGSERTSALRGAKLPIQDGNTSDPASFLPQKSGIVNSLSNSSDNLSNNTPIKSENSSMTPRLAQKALVSTHDQPPKEESINAINTGTSRTYNPETYQDEQLNGIVDFNDQRVKAESNDSYEKLLERRREEYRLSREQSGQFQIQPNNKVVSQFFTYFHNLPVNRS